MKQLHWRNSFRPVHLNELRNKQKGTVLKLHIFMKKKQTGGKMAGLKIAPKVYAISLLTEKGSNNY